MTTLELFPLTDSAQMELPSMSSAEASPARTSASPEAGRGWQANAPAYGVSTPELLASFDPATSSWKTSQLCFLEGLTTYSGAWPRSGMTRNGIAYQLPPLVPLTGATGSGLWQTPVADDAVNRKNGKWNSRGEPKLSAQVLWPTPQANDNRNRGHLGMPAIQRRALIGKQLMLSMVVSDTSGQLNPTFVEWLMGFPLGWTDCEP